MTCISNYCFLVPETNELLCPPVGLSNIGQFQVMEFTENDDSDLEWDPLFHASTLMKQVSLTLMTIVLPKSNREKKEYLQFEFENTEKNVGMMWNKTYLLYVIWHSYSRSIMLQRIMLMSKH